MKPLTLTLQLLDWSENKRGRKVIFEVLDDPDNPSDTHPFAEYTARNGKVAGQFFAGVFVQYDPGTGKPVEQATVLVQPDKQADTTLSGVPKTREESTSTATTEPDKHPVKHFDEMLLSQQAAILCKDIQFQAWMVKENGWAGAGTEEGCKTAICFPCQLTSRAQLDTNAEAAEVFRSWLFHFGEWKERQNRVAIKAGDNW